jgi:WD40 repeat protein
VFDELRNLAVAALALPDFRAAAKTWDGWPEGSSGLDFDPVALRLYARGDRQGNVSVRRLEDDKEVARLPGTGRARAIIFGAEGRTLLLHDSKIGALERWPIGGPPPRRVAKIANDVCLWQQSRDGRRLLALHQSPRGTRTEVIDLPSGRHRFVHRSPTHDKWMTRWRAALSPDGKWLALADGVYGSTERNRLLLFNLDSGKSAGVLPTIQALAPAWHPDSRTLAVANWNGGVSVWDAPAGKMLRTLSDQLSGEQILAMSPSGQLLTSWGTWNGGQVFWHPHTGRPLLRTPFNYSVSRTVQDGRQYQVGIDKTQLTLRIVEPSPVFRTLAPEGHCYEAAIHPGGRLLAVGQGNGVTLFDLATGLKVRHLDLENTFSVRFDQSNGDLLTYGQRGLFRWPVRITRGSPETVAVGPPRLLGRGSNCRFDASQDGKVTVTANYSQAMVYRQVGKRLRAIPLAPLTDCRLVRLSPDGHWALTMSHAEGADALVWDARTGRQVARVRRGSWFFFTPDSRWLTDGRRRRKVGTWKEGPAVPVADGPKVQAFSPDGALFAGQSNDEPVHLISAATGKTLVQLGLPEPSRTWFGVFSPDGTQLILQSTDYFYLYAWDLRALRGHLAGLGLDWDAPPYPPAREGEGCLPLVVKNLGPSKPSVRGDDAAAHYQVGVSCALMGRWKEAAAAFDRGLKLDPSNHERWYHAAALYLAAGDVQGYRNICRRMLERFADQPVLAERTAKACLLLPGALSPPDQDRVQKLAQKAVTGTEKHGYYRYFVLAKGLADYRAGRHADAVNWLGRFSPKADGVHWDATALAVLAMAHHRLGKVEEARLALARAEAILKQKMPDPAVGRPYGAGDWHDWLHAQILCREAERQLKK